MNYIEKDPNTDDVDILLQQVEQIEAIRGQLKTIQSQQKQLDLQLWIWDESYWNYLK